MQALGAGQTGCLPAGAVFEERLVIGSQGTSTRPVMLTTPEGPRAVIGEGIEFLQSSRSVVVSRVGARMSGREPYNALGAVVQIGGFRNQLVRSEVWGGGVVDKSRTCVLIDHGNLALVDRNLIHECGTVEANPAIYAPGIRIATGGSATITNNTIWSTAGDGIALAPNAQGARVRNNMIDGTTNGVFLSGTRGSRPTATGSGTTSSPSSPAMPPTAPTPPASPSGRGTSSRRTASGSRAAASSPAPGSRHPPTVCSTRSS